MKEKSNANKPKKLQVKKLSFRQRLTLTTAVCWSVAFAILLAGTMVGYYAVTTLYQNKLIDTWAIMFLELEQQGTRLQDALDKKSIESNGMDNIFEEASDGALQPLQGAITQTLRPKDFGFDTAKIVKNISPVTFVKWAGEMFLLSREITDPKLIRLRKVQPAMLRGVFGRRDPADASVYMVTREGRLIYSSDKNILESTFKAKTLVQKFIAAPLTHGQLEFKDERGVLFYGFFREIPDSNVVMFSEIEQSKALMSLKTFIYKFILVLIGIIASVILILQYPLIKITSPLRELAALATRVGQGEFSIKPLSVGFGEVSQVSQAFASMIDGLVMRDRSIQDLMKEQVEKHRIEGELRLAQSIQSNLLPSENLPDSSGIDLKAAYIPATECAGDWYGYHYNADTEESIVAIADVSGHGFGSALFTAIIAGLFTRFIKDGAAGYRPEVFMREVNEVMCQLGGGQSHATMLVTKFRKKDLELDLFFGGHNPPFVAYPKHVDLKSRRLLGPSNYLGAGLAYEPFHMTVPFPVGARLLLYTDGLVELRGPKGDALGNKRVGAEFYGNADLTAEQMTKHVVSLWQKHRVTLQAQDDTCVIVMKAVS